MDTLMRISHGERPLKANELCGALAVELGFIDFNSGNIFSMLTLLSKAHTAIPRLFPNRYVN